MFSDDDFSDLADEDPADAHTAPRTTTGRQKRPPAATAADPVQGSPVGAPASFLDQQDRQEQIPQASAAVAAAVLPSLAPVYANGQWLLLVAVDIEMTSPSRYSGAPASVGACLAPVEVQGGLLKRIDGGVPVSLLRFEQYVRPPPHCVPNPVCSAIHKIPEATLRAAPLYEDVMAAFYEQISTVVAKFADSGRRFDNIVMMAHNGTSRP